MAQVTLKKVGLFLFKVAVWLCILVPLALLLGQHAMIYHERSYGESYQGRLPANAVELRSSTAEGEQLSFYVPPQDRTVRQPERIWVMFPGNASLALEWAHFIREAPNKQDGFLLIEFPGYGASQGSASPESIDEATEKAYDTMVAKLDLPREMVDRKVNILGLSLGGGAALKFATRHPAEHIVLIAPFTSLKDCARRLVGWPLCHLLRHNFDNRARLAELAAKQPTPKITIFHGSEDITVPTRMGRELAELFPQMITFREVAGADHDSVVAESLPWIYEAMER
jgi:pimeloyl-ACP methyl ester carboxylesterase